jgi:hypothetical protein
LVACGWVGVAFAITGPGGCGVMEMVSGLGSRDDRLGFGAR